MTRGDEEGGQAASAELLSELGSSTRVHSAWPLDVLLDPEGLDPTGPGRWGAAKRKQVV